VTILTNEDTVICFPSVT